MFMVNVYSIYTSPMDPMGMIYTSIFHVCKICARSPKKNFDDPGICQNWCSVYVSKASKQSLFLNYTPED